MTAILVGLIIILFGFLCLLAYGFTRNNRTFKFRQNILHNYIFNNPERWDEKVKVFNKVSYEKMAFDFFHPLKLETYWTDEDIQILKS